MDTMSDELAQHLDSLARDDCYRVDAVLKESACEATQKVYFVGANGAEQGPFVRKYFDGDSGLGAAYERIWQAQRSGVRFLHLPRIVECYALGADSAVIMEFVVGETLSDVVYRCDPSIALACDVFPRLCDAVRELHESFDPPLIHRDLKPSNIMLSRDSLTIIDFGIARTYDEGAESDTHRFGTRAFAPPEQFGFRQTDVRSDVYALGMILYFCLTEKIPDAKAAEGGFADEGVPDPLRAVIARATQFDPVDRYADVAGLQAAFAQAAAAVPGAGAWSGEAMSATSAPADDPLSAQAMPSGKDPVATGYPVPIPPPAADAVPVPIPPPVSVAAAAAYTPPGALTGVAGAGKDGPAHRLSLAVGAVWDVLVVLFFLLFFAVATSIAIAPQPTDAAADAPLALRLLIYEGLIFGVFAPGFFLVLDRRPLRRLFPRLAPFSKRTVICCAIVFVIGFLTVGIASQFA